MQVLCFHSTEFVLSLRNMLLGSFYLKGIDSGHVIKRNNIFLFFLGFCVLTNDSGRILK
jgi:hypothetical protein